VANDKPITVPLNPKERDRPCDPDVELPQDRYELLANATPAESEAEFPFDDCKKTKDRAFRLADLFPSRVMGQDADQLAPFLGPFLEALDPEMLAAFERVDCFPSIMDPNTAPSRFLDGLLAHLGSPFILEEGLSDLEKRRLASMLFEVYKLKGTCPGIIGAVRLLYGITVTDCVQANVDCWTLDVDLLGVTTVLCGSTAQERRTFSVMVSQNLTQKQREQLTNVVDYMKPANTFFAGFIEPGAPRFIDHWVLDISKLGKNTDLHA
jgi:phage tail-like protein